jgi:FixJ family two-component response regulator
MKTEQIIYVLDDDASVCKYLAAMFEAAGLRCVTFESGAAFLAEAQVNRPSCLILDLHLSQMSGVDVLLEMDARQIKSMPVIVLSGTGNVSVAVQSMKLGVHDFLEKPVDHKLLLAKVREALLIDMASRAQATRRSIVQARLDRLTDREREVLRLLCEGKSSKQMSTLLKISVKTVAIHRWHMMKKMEASSATEAVHMVHSVKDAELYGVNSSARSRYMPSAS